MEPVRIFLDTNIVLDYFSGRMGDGLATKIVQIGRDSRYRMCISMLTAINVLYIAKKIAPQITPEVLDSLFDVLPMDIKQWKDAKTLDMQDFEDAIQSSCALNNSCFFVISRDAHFACAPLVTFSPEEFIHCVTQR